MDHGGLFSTPLELTQLRKIKTQILSATFFAMIVSFAVTSSGVETRSTQSG